MLLCRKNTLVRDRDPYIPLPRLFSAVAHPCVSIEEDKLNDPDLLCEPASSGPIATGSVKKFAAFWRTFVKSS